MTERGVVWVVTQAYPHEGEAVYGVYASKEDAERACDGPTLWRGGEWCIYAVPVGGPARSYGWHDREGNHDA